jgi:hypothetical protein
MQFLKISFHFLDVCIIPLVVFIRIFPKLRHKIFKKFFINRQLPIFSQTKKKEKIKYSQGFRVLKNISKNNGVEG